jgi:hypothetical protein
MLQTPSRSGPTSGPCSPILIVLVAAATCAGRVAAAPPPGSPQLDGRARVILGPGGERADDAVRHGILAGTAPVPATIFEVRRKLERFGGSLATHIVANRGFENPEAGSFSFFESYAGPIPGRTVSEGELFLGFFSERRGDTLAVQQSFAPGLMIELIAWDWTKRAFNFWELVGNGTGSEWHYRGDSGDILADVARINVGAVSPQFGKRLRCSGCHTLGGPIMKELSPPHNDWWTDEHKLSLGTIRLRPGPDAANPENAAARLFASAHDASNLSRLVRVSTDRMIAERAARAGDGQDLKQELRSLFATMEMNLASDLRPWTERTARPPPSPRTIQVPAAFFADERLTGDRTPVEVPADVYGAALGRAGVRFAPDEVAGLAETRHAFLVPVRSHVDDAVIDSLVRRGLLDDELVADVLAVDPTTPVYSAGRASLIRFVPARAQSAADLRAQLVEALRGGDAAGRDAAARELLANLTDPARTAAHHRQAARAFLDTCRRQAGSPDIVSGWLSVASQRRLEVAAAETSRNPRGTILEPGFRVIFPVDRLQSRPGRLRLDPATAGALGGASPGRRARPAADRPGPGSGR